MPAFNPSEEVFYASFEKMVKKIEDAGYRRKIPGMFSFLEYSSHILLHFLFLWLAIYFNDNLLLFFGFITLSTLSGIGITTGTHTASHYRLFKSKRLNDAIVYFGYGFIFGSSREYWMFKHIETHHPNPNIVGVDLDIDLLPWFVLSQEDYEAGSKFARSIYRLQWLTIPFALTLNLFNVQKDSFVYLFKKTARTGLTRKLAKDLFIMLSHFIVWLVIPSFFFSFGEVFLLYFIRAAFMGYAMFATFAPAHFPENALFLTSKNKELNFVIRQIYTTTNFRAGLLGKYLLGGVQYQIEHHLFPKIHHIHYPKVNVLLKEFCKESNLPYNEIGWLNGIWKSYRVFFVPKRISASVDDKKLYTTPEMNVSEYLEKGKATAPR